jgi:small subunit ribosomal protein S17
MSQIYVGTVIGLKNAKTARVEIVSTEIHSKYHKQIKRRKKLQVHNPEYSLQLGEKVVIESSRPFSATKRFIIKSKEKTRY